MVAVAPRREDKSGWVAASEQPRRRRGRNGRIGLNKIGSLHRAYPLWQGCALLAYGDDSY